MHNRLHWPVPYKIGNVSLLSNQHAQAFKTCFRWSKGPWDELNLCPEVHKRAGNPDSALSVLCCQNIRRQGLLRQNNRRSVHKSHQFNKNHKNWHRLDPLPLRSADSQRQGLWHRQDQKEKTDQTVIKKTGEGSHSVLKIIKVKCVWN